MLGRRSKRALGIEHPVVVMRLLAELLLAPKRPTRTERRSWCWRCRRTKKPRQVAATIKLELARPNSDRNDFSDCPDSTSPLSTGDSELPWKLEAIIDLQQQAKRPKVFPGKALGIDLSHIAEAGEAFLDFSIVPMFNGEVQDGDESQPSRNAEETVRGFLRFQ